MASSWRQRFREFLCKHFGHTLAGESWKFKDHKYDICTRCNLVVDNETMA